ncbi:MAG TPA: helix-turn-helix domain-containing protein [Clostridia bacterium]|nr:helix-turn-helix domain-containing protein [Clostridia bacterium]
MSQYEKINKVLKDINSQAQTPLFLYDGAGALVTSFGKPEGIVTVIPLHGGHTLKVYTGSGDTRDYSFLGIMLNSLLDSAEPSTVEMIFSGRFSGDIASELGLPAGGRMVAACIINEGNGELDSILDNVFGSEDVKRIRVTAHETAVVSNLDKLGYNELAEIFTALLEDASRELPSCVYIGLGGVFEGVDLLHQSYRQAKEAAVWARKKTAACAFVEFKNVLLEHINTKPFNDYIKNLEALKGMDEFLNGNFKSFFNVFITKNLNVSDTAREVYMHRNTIKYKIDKLRRLSGLDIRRFNDAVAFKLLVSASDSEK